MYEGVGDKESGPGVNCKFGMKFAINGKRNAMQSQRVHPTREAARRPPERKTPMQSREPPAEERSLFRVLIVEDHKDVADSLRMLLELWGFAVQTVYDGATALAAARAFRPDCMLLDIGLPGLDGYRLAEQVRRDEELKRTPLVAITAYSDEARALAAGFDHHLVKPADPTRLETLLRSIHAMKHQLDRTEKLALEQLTLVGETRDMVREVKQEMKAVKEELKEVKDEVREVKEELREVKKDQDRS